MVISLSKVAKNIKVKHVNMKLRGKAIVIVLISKKNRMVYTLQQQQKKKGFRSLGNDYQCQSFHSPVDKIVSTERHYQRPKPIILDYLPALVNSSIH